MTNGKKKGARGEREWSAFCHAHGYETRRTQQYCGGSETCGTAEYRGRNDAGGT